jgi:hypothetical protein
LDSLFQFPSFYHGEKTWKILLSELVHEAAVRVGFRIVFLRKSENRDKKIFQYTIGFLRYKVYGGNKKKVSNAASKKIKGKDIGPGRLHADGIKKTAIKGGKHERRNLDERKLPLRRYNMLPVEKEEMCPFRMTIYFKKKDGLFLLSIHGPGCEHKGHSKKTNLKTSAARTTKPEIKTVKAMVQYPIKARGEAGLFEKLTGKKYTTKQVFHLMKKSQEHYDKDTQDEQDWTFKNTTFVTKLIEYLTMTKYIRFMILIHDPMLIPQVRPARKYPIPPWEMIHFPGEDNAVCR